MVLRHQFSSHEDSIRPPLAEPHGRSVHAEMMEIFHKGDVASDLVYFLKGEEKQSNVADK